MSKRKDFTRLVDLFTGTDAAHPDFGTGGGAGNTFPGATLPFGMIQWSPDTIPSSVNVGGGFSYADRKIRGFSLTHLSGVGCPVFMDVPILPITVPVEISPAVAGSYDIEPRYVPDFDHGSEWARPGRYRVTLETTSDHSVGVDLTTTTRTGCGRFRYPRRVGCGNAARRRR